MKLQTALGKEKSNQFLTKHSASNQNSVDNLYTDFVNFMNSQAREDLSCRPKRVKRTGKKGMKKRKPMV